MTETQINRKTSITQCAQGSKERDILLRTQHAFVPGAVFQCPRKAEAQAGVAGVLTSALCVFDSGQWLMLLRL